MKRARVLTSWTGDGVTQETATRPALLADYALESCTDVTGQPAENLQPDPNLFAVEIVCDDAVLEAIDADSTYLVLWDEDVSDA